MKTGSRQTLLALVTLLSFILTLASCGSGSSPSLGGGTPPPPQSREFLFGNGVNSVLSFSIDTETGAPTQTSSIARELGDGFSITANPAVTFLYVDDVLNGGIDCFSISSTGALSLVSGSPFPMPAGWAPNQVDNIAIDPTGKFLYVPDSVSNVVGFTMDGSTGALAPMSGSPFPAGPSPSEIAITPSGEFLYASNGNGISAYTVDASSGNLSPIAGSPFPTPIGAPPDGVVVHPLGKFLYVALTSLNGIAAFSIDSSTGGLTSVPGSPFYPSLNGTYPFIYSIAISPSGQFLYAQGADNGQIYGFTVDTSTGALSETASSPLLGIATYMSNLVVDPSGAFLYVGTEGNSFFYLNIDPTTGALTLSENAEIGFSRTLAVVKTP